MRNHDPADIALCLAKQHGEGDPIEENIIPNPTILPVTHSEVTDAIRKALTHSTIGQDDIGLPLIKGYHTRKPTTFARIFTDILRSGDHPEQWKKATVVPIPKANKASYNTAKEWRSIL